MAADNVLRGHFEEAVKRLDQRIDGHDREISGVRKDMRSIDEKLDKVLENQSRWQGRDGVILVIVMAVVSILATVIAASILGVL